MVKRRQAIERPSSRDNRKQKGTSSYDHGRAPAADQNTPYPSGCTLFSPFRGLEIGADHSFQPVESVLANKDSIGQHSRSLELGSLTCRSCSESEAVRVRLNTS